MSGGGRSGGAFRGDDEGGGGCGDGGLGVVGVRRYGGVFGEAGQGESGGDDAVDEGGGRPVAAGGGFAFGGRAFAFVEVAGEQGGGGCVVVVRCGIGCACGGVKGVSGAQHEGAAGYEAAMDVCQYGLRIGVFVQCVGAEGDVAGLRF